MNYKIYPVYLGSLDIPSSAIFYRDKTNVMMRMSMGAFVLQDENGEFIIFDTGGPSNTESDAKGYPFERTEEVIEYEDQIRKIGVEPEKVKLVILSHLHWDHVWHNALFPNADMYVMEDEIITAIRPHKTSLKTYGWVSEIEPPKWINAIRQLHPVKDDLEIREGLLYIRTPGHSEGSASLIVDTKEGRYALIADYAMNMRNMTEAIPNGSCDTVSGWYRSYDKLMRTGAQFLPTHDPDIYKKEVYG